MGINGLSIGTESGDDQTLLLANKGYTAADIVEQCRKLDEAGIEYYFVYMTGLAGKGGGYRNAVESARLFSQLNPCFISVDSLTLFPDTELYAMAQRGEFTPASERERLEELQIFIRNLQIRTHLFANSISNYYPVTAYLPKERERVISDLQYILDTASEQDMQRYRAGLKSLGRDESKFNPPCKEKSNAVQRADTKDMQHEMGACFEITFQNQKQRGNRNIPSQHNKRTAKDRER